MILQPLFISPRKYLGQFFPVIEMVSKCQQILEGDSSIDLVSWSLGVLLTLTGRPEQ